jgi:hypothetical protein
VICDNLKSYGINLFDDFSEGVENRVKMFTSGGAGPDILQGLLQSLSNAALAGLSDIVNNAVQGITDKINDQMAALTSIFRFFDLLNPNMYKAVLISHTAEKMTDDINKNIEYLKLNEYSLNQILSFLQQYKNTTSDVSNIKKFLAQVQRANRSMARVDRTIGNSSADNDRAYYEESNLESASNAYQTGLTQLMTADAAIHLELTTHYKVYQATTEAEATYYKYTHEPAFGLYSGSSPTQVATVAEFNEANKLRKTSSLLDELYPVGNEERAKYEAIIAHIKTILELYKNKKMTPDELAAQTGYTVDQVQNAKTLLHNAGISIYNHMVDPLIDTFKELARRFIRSVYNMSENKAIPKSLYEGVDVINIISSLRGGGIAQYIARNVKNKATLDQMMIPLLSSVYLEDSSIGGLGAIPEALQYISINTVRSVFKPVYKESVDFENEINANIAEDGEYTLAARKGGYHTKGLYIASRLGILPAFLGELNKGTADLRTYFTKFPGVKANLTSLNNQSQQTELATMYANFIADIPVLLAKGAQNISGEIENINNILSATIAERKRQTKMKHELRKLFPTGVESVDEGSRVLSNLIAGLKDWAVLLDAGLISVAASLYEAVANGCGGSVNGNKGSKDITELPDKTLNNFDAFQHTKLEFEADQYMNLKDNKYSDSEAQKLLDSNYEGFDQYYMDEVTELGDIE